MSLADYGDDQGFRGLWSRIGTIAAPDGDVLPRLASADLCDALRRLPEEEVELALRHKLLPIVNLRGLRLYAACGAAGIAEAEARGLSVAAYASTPDLLGAARAVLGPELVGSATRSLARSLPDYSASTLVTPAQAAVFSAMAMAAAAAAILLPFPAVWGALSLLGGLFFLAVVAVRVLALMPALPSQTIRPPRLRTSSLPVYSVLVPLFRETAVLGQLIEALDGLDYPHDLLDIKLILEEEDVAMRRAVAGLELGPEYEVIVVPAGAPQTKPRALNYALSFARGELLTIYDAEDVPEPGQLRKAAEMFACLPPEVACLQAALGFYNRSENWLTRQFTAEYAGLFNVMLPALANHRLPLLLGGTSNHFRIAALREAGAWDPYNVTEDADLGLRLSRLGYSTGILDSTTLEEANVRLGNWMRQRARWLKGFLITWLVHMRHPSDLLRELGPAGFLVAQAMTLGVFASALLHPVCLVTTAVLWWRYPLVPDGAGPALIAVAGLNVAVLAAGYGAAMLVSARGLRRLGLRRWSGVLATLPVYWMLMSAAAWYGLWQFFRAPFHWNKTEHGLSRQRPFRKPRRRRLGEALSRGKQA